MWRLLALLCCSACCEARATVDYSDGCKHTWVHTLLQIYTEPSALRLCGRKV